MGRLEADPPLLVLRRAGVAVRPHGGWRLASVAKCAPVSAIKRSLAIGPTHADGLTCRIGCSRWPTPSSPIFPLPLRERLKITAADAAPQPRLATPGSRPTLSAARRPQGTGTWHGHHQGRHGPVAQQQAWCDFPRAWHQPSWRARLLLSVPVILAAWRAANFDPSRSRDVTAPGW